MARNDKIFYENAGAGIYNAAWNTGSGGWLNTNYRQITLEKPATGELKTWLEANAVRLPLEGTYVFNEKLTTANPPLRTDIAFVSNGTEFTSINTGGGGNVGEPTKSYPLFYNDTNIDKYLDLFLVYDILLYDFYQQYIYQFHLLLKNNILF